MLFTSSLNKISTDQLGKNGGEGGGGEVALLNPFQQQASGRIFKDDVSGFPSASGFLLPGSIPNLNF